MLFDLPTFTLIHIVLSLLGIFSGLVVVGGFMAGVRLDGWIGAYLITTVLTNVTGYGFPFLTLLPGHIVGAISLVLLAIAIAARYWKHLAGGWRKVFVVTSVLALYLNVLILVDQLFRKTVVLLAIAPTQKSPPVLVTQLLVVVVFVFMGRAAVRGFGTPRT